MVRRNGVTEQAKTVGVCDVSNRCWLWLACLEKGWLVDVCRISFPFICESWFYLQRVPCVRAFSNFAVVLVEHVGHNNRCCQCFNFVSAGPNISQINILSLRRPAQRRRIEIKVNISDQGESHTKRGRGEIVGFSERMHTALKIAISRKHGCRNEIVLGNDF